MDGKFLFAKLGELFPPPPVVANLVVTLPAHPHPPPAHTFSGWTAGTWILGSGRRPLTPVTTRWRRRSPRRHRRLPCASTASSSAATGMDECWPECCPPLSCLIPLRVLHPGGKVSPILLTGCPVCSLLFRRLPAPHSPFAAAAGFRPTVACLASPRSPSTATCGRRTTLAWRWCSRAPSSTPRPTAGV